MSVNQKESKGFLRRCIDRRFHEQTRQLFERATGLGRNDYWDEGVAGGAAVEVDSKGADHAAHSGATIWGWGAHGSHCGGQPNASDSESATALDSRITRLKQKYKGRHFRIFVTEDSEEIREV